MATGDSIGVLLDVWVRVPVYHYPTTRPVQRYVDRPPVHTWFTRCGREVSDYSDPFLRLYHLARFARACHRCYPDAAERDEAARTLLGSLTDCNASLRSGGDSTSETPEPLEAVRTHGSEHGAA